MRVGSATLYGRGFTSLRLVLTVIMTAFSMLGIAGCSKEAPKTSSTINVEYQLPSDGEMMVLLESCGQETYQGVRALIRDVEVKDIPQLKIDYKKFREIEKDSGPICVVARGPIDKFTSQIEVD